jgi:hypothetical protein
MHDEVTHGHDGVPECEYDQEERDGHMDEQPSVQPMLQLGLQIRPSPFVAARLQFLDAWQPFRRDIQLQKSECVIAFALAAEPVPIAAPQPEIRQRVGS